MKPESAPRVKGLVTTGEIVDALGISRQTVNQMINAGEFKTLQLMGSEKRPFYVIKVAELETFKETRVFPRSKG